MIAAIYARTSTDQHLPDAEMQNPFVERVIGSIRREGLDHLMI
jgi:hypothetical protein